MAYLIAIQLEGDGIDVHPILAFAFAIRDWSGVGPLLVR
jgi:hypothetical protein